VNGSSVAPMDGQRSGVPRARIDRFRDGVRRWFRENARHFWWRKRPLSPYEILVTEALLQRTRAATVDGFLPSFFQRFPDPSTLAKARATDIEDFLRPVGLWRRRAATLGNLARELQRRGGSVPTSREELETLPGVGQYLASAVLLLAHRANEPLLDSNMARVLERYFGPRTKADIRYDPYLQALSREVLRGADPVRLNWGILDFAALVCTPRAPRCDSCTLKVGCRYYGSLTRSAGRGRL
jgi:A/G-specific adenine glycosylase